jgi:hypothetical protein
MEMRDPTFFVSDENNITSAYVKIKSNLHKCKIDPITWKAKITSPPIQNIDTNSEEYAMYFGYKNGKNLFMTAKLGSFNHSIFGWDLHHEMTNKFTPPPEAGFVQAIDVSVKQWYWIQIPKLKPPKTSKWNRGETYWKDEFSGMGNWTCGGILDFDAAFKQIRSTQYDNKTRTIVWRILRLAFYYGKRCNYIPNMHSTCSHCKQTCAYCNDDLNEDGICEDCYEDVLLPPSEVEHNTPIHIFFECPFLTPFWDHIERLCEKFSINVPNTRSLKIWFFISGCNITHPKQPFHKLWLGMHSTYIKLVWNHYYSPFKSVIALTHSFEKSFMFNLKANHKALLHNQRLIESKMIVGQAQQKEIDELRKAFDATWCHPNLCILEQNSKLTINHTFVKPKFNKQRTNNP